jgi:hypothetical protein
MSNYIPHYTKKREARRRREQALQRLVERGVGGAKLIQAAEEVRAARVRELLARLARIPPADGRKSASFRKITADIEALRVMRVEAILEEFNVPPHLTSQQPAASTTASKSRRDGKLGDSTNGDPPRA